MKLTELKLELLFLLLAILPMVTFFLRYVYEPAETMHVLSASMPERGRLEATVKNEGGEGMASVWVEQGRRTICSADAFIAGGQTLRVTLPCPGLEALSFRVMARAR